MVLSSLFLDSRFYCFTLCFSVGMTVPGCSDLPFLCFNIFTDSSTLCMCAIPKADESYCPSSDFFYTNNLPMSTLGRKVICIVINLFVFWSNYMSSSLVDFKNCLEYLIMENIREFISYMSFLLKSLFLRIFCLILLLLLLLF